MSALGESNRPDSDQRFLCSPLQQQWTTTEQHTSIFASDSVNTEPAGKIDTQVEVYEEKFPLKETIGGVIGGLVLLALIAAGLYKAGFFKSNYKKMLEEAGAGAEGTGNSAEALSED